jgi:hypothetical protein
VIGNSVWHLGRGAPIDQLAREQDFIQVEVQTRTFPGPDEGPPCWERFTFPTETTRYLAPLGTRRPPIVVASYFLAWPWRRVAVPYAEQKLYLAQIAANGASPMVNLSGGPPAVHEDPRGFQAIQELYGFMDAHADLYEGDRSGAALALLFCPESAALAAGGHGGYERYLANLHLWEDALNRAQIPFDIVSTANLGGVRVDRYAAVVLPDAAALTEQAAQELARLQAAGVGLVADGAPGTLQPGGEPRTEPLTNDLLGIRTFGASAPGLAARHAGLAQAYARPVPPHPLLEGIDASLIAFAGPWHTVVCAGDAFIPIVRAAPFRVFPEGLSYPDEPDPAEPLAVLRDPADAGRTVFFPFAAGKCARRTGHPDNALLMTNAARWAARARMPLAAAVHPDVLATVRDQPGRRLIHLVNAAGAVRHRSTFTPLTDLALRVRLDAAPLRVRLASTGRGIEADFADGVAGFLVPRLTDYDIVVLDLVP